MIKTGTKFSIMLCLLLIYTVALQAQEVVTSSGGYGTTAGARVTWTIGEPVTETLSGTNSILTQGFNQGDIIITMIRNPEKPGLTFKVYPNPASDHIRISAAGSETGNLKYMIIDMSGKVLIEKNLSGAESDISVGHLAPSNYFLKVYQNNREIGVFKIIKK